MHKVWSGIAEKPYCFSRLFIKFQVTLAEKLKILTRIVRLRTVTLVWIHIMLGNDAQTLKWLRRGALLIFKVIRQISRSPGRKIYDFALVWAFLGQLQLYFMGGYEMKHIAFRSMEEVPYSQIWRSRGLKNWFFYFIWGYKAGHSYQIPQICLVITTIMKMIMFITRDSEGDIFFTLCLCDSVCVFICLSPCLFGRFNYKGLVPHNRYFAGT